MVEFDGVIFDLDGTLVDTLEDIADAMDRVLALEGAPGHSYDEYRYLIGHGIRNLVTESLPAELRSDERVARCYERMLEDYGAHLLVKTRAYDGRARAGARAASRRSAARDPLEQGGRADAGDRRGPARPGRLRAVSGARPDAPLKPDPAVALAIAARFGLPPARVVYLGDSLVDMRTATAAGMIAVGAAWGFRTPEELVESGARVGHRRAARPARAARLTARPPRLRLAPAARRRGQASAPASRSSSRNAGMSAGCAADHGRPGAVRAAQQPRRRRPRGRSARRRRSPTAERSSSQ